ncbi:hypothetical protein WN943_025794 [Citrus x changshan-huyou]
MLHFQQGKKEQHAASSPEFFDNMYSDLVSYVSHAVWDLTASICRHFEPLSMVKRSEEILVMFQHYY